MAERSAELAALHDLALQHGVLPSYRVMGGRVEVRASPEALLAVLRGLDVPIQGPGEAPDLLRAARSAAWSRLGEPVAVAWEGSPGAVPLRLLAAEADGEMECTLRLEDGEERRWRAPATTLLDAASQEAEGLLFVGGQLPLPAGLPSGYHDLVVRAGARVQHTRLLVAPPTVWEPETGGTPRDFGLFLPLYALRTGRSWGTADLGDLERLLEWAGERGASFLGTLPLTAAFLDERGPFDPSPYAPVSRLFWSELWLDVERAPGLERSPAARELLASPTFQDEVRRLRDAPRVRYREAMALKRRVLEELARAVAPADQPLPGELAGWVEGRPEALDYARFRAVTERQGTPWGEWPPAPRAGSPGSGDFDEAGLRYHLFVQWVLDRQMRGPERGGGPSLYLDLPLGAHPKGYDVWRRREVFALGLSGGAPPDAFFEGGQDWGFPPLHPARSRADGHAYTAACLRHVMGAAGMLRLDHVMSLHRLFCVPAGLPASQGVYVGYPAEELYAVLTIESRRARCEVVGEDLGTVADEVHDAMARHRLRRMVVLPFEMDVKEPKRAGGRPRPVGELRPVPPLSVASVGTHDLPPFAAFWSGRDLEGVPGKEDELEERARWRGALAALLHREGLMADETVPEEEQVRRAHQGALALLAGSPAEHLLVGVEDLWLETEPQNRPGTGGEMNWTRKARYPLEEWSRLAGVEETLAAVREARRRGPGPPRARSRKERAR